jgi:CheY-like chemotaxis protein
MKMEAVGRLAGGVAHDFNNLLTSIICNVELAEQELNASDPLVQYLSEVNRAAQSAASLTRQLLAFSRKQIIEPKVLNLNYLVGNIQKMMTRLIGEDIELRTILAKELGSVKVDAGQFEQVLVNLAVNARDAMPEGGVLIIETANIDLDADYSLHHPHTQPGKYIMLAVSDTGHGMSEEVKEHLFEPFFTTKGKGRGTGLGLATTFGAVKQAGGSIEVYSEVDRGTTFKIYLPRIDEQAATLARTTPSLDLLHGTETILVVEDEPGVREMALKILKRFGYTTLHAPSGEDAFILAAKFADRIDLLLTDVVMPGMNGRELAERITLLHPEMKVLFTSGYTENVIVHHGVIEENLNFIGKPYSPQGLAQKIREVLGPGNKKEIQ